MKFNSEAAGRYPEAVNKLPDLSQFDAVLFDLDGVLTPTAEVHRHAWRQLFSDYLDSRSVTAYADDDYERHLDGLQRYDGVEKLLASRGIELPRGTPDDPPGTDTVCALGNRKNVVFREILERQGVTPFPGAVALARSLVRAGVSVAVVSSSRNAAAVLQAAGLTDLFPLVIGGVEAANLGLESKPAPDSFLHAAELLGADPARSVVVEDAVSGVAAGRAGNFGLVVGVAEGVQAERLREAGADLVLSGLGGLAEQVQAHGMDRERFPVDEWRLLETRPPEGVDGHAETLFALGNGYLGLRGNPEEGGLAHEHGTFLNGFHETWQITYPEAGYGFASVGQTIVNVPDARTIRVTVDGETFSTETSRFSDYSRELDFRSGMLTRRLLWHTRSGKRLRLEFRRLVSFTRRELALLELDVTALDGPVNLEVESLLINRQDGEGEFRARQAPGGFDPRRTDNLQGRVLQPEVQLAAGARSGLAYRTSNSGLTVATLVQHEPSGESNASPDVCRSVFHVQLAGTRTWSLTKTVVWLSGPAGSSGAELLGSAEVMLDEAQAVGTAGIKREQQEWLSEFWRRSDVLVGGASDLQQAVRWNLFQLLQSAARAEGHGVSAKGVSGSGYSGHYFWDTEIFVLPFLIHSLPEAARSALELRHALLPAARRRAEVMSVNGALYPWRTINGEEASAYYPAGTAQYHINADVAYAVLHYSQVTGDSDFRAGPGAEILIETARMWLSLGFFGPDGFHIHSVTGPDEYSAVVNDNLYTNALARLNLQAAADAAEANPGLLGCTSDEAAEWRRAAASMVIPFDRELGIHAQDSEFLKRERWDLAATPREKRPLLLHYHPLVIYRHQVLKQTDLVLAEYLLSDEFSPEQKLRDFEYYDPLTSGDSTLSAAVQSIMAAEVGHQRRAFRHFTRMLYTDLADLHANTADGVHVAAMGGTWLALVAGFGGMRSDSGQLRFDPRLPAGWDSLTFQLQWQSSRIGVKLLRAELRFSLLSGRPVAVSVRGQKVEITGTVPVPLADQGPRLD